MANSYVKIKNVSGKPVNFVIALPSSGSKGILLNNGECVIASSSYINGTLLKTASLGVQERRGLVQIQENFNNDLYQLPLNQNLSSATVEEKVRLSDAEQNAENYMKS